MINLLPSKTKLDMMYARKNSVLFHWATALAIALIGVVLVIGSGMIYLTQTTKAYEKRADIGRKSLQEQKITDTQAEVDEISNNVKLTTQVLSREILFSKLLQQLGQSLPAETSLLQLQIGNLEGGITLSAGAKSIDSATQLLVNLQDEKNQIFEKADIENIECSSTEDKIYPCTVKIRALFMKQNPYLYITPAQTGAKP